MIVVGAAAGAGVLGGTGGGTAGVDDDGAGGTSGTGTVCARTGGAGETLLEADLDGPSIAATCAERLTNDLNSYFDRMYFSRSLSLSESTILVGGG